jgi:hypothetical protein
MPSQPNGTSGEDLVGYLDEILRMMTNTGKAWAAGDTATTRQSMDRGEASLDFRNLLNFLAQANLVLMTSSLRCWRRLTEIYGSYSPAISRSLLETIVDGSGSGEERGLLIDNLRACFREMADLPCQESRLLRAELEQIERAVWSATEAEKAAPYWRRWRAKL